MVARYTQVADDLGLLLTGGSDFHGDPAHGLMPGSVTLPTAHWERLLNRHRAHGRLLARSSSCEASPRTTAVFGRCGSSGSSVDEGDSVALLGFDQTTAEVLVSLITGAITPDSGDVRVFGRSTRDIVDGEAWLQGLDQFGILSERAVLLDQLTAEQNLAVPFSLDARPDGREPAIAGSRGSRKRSGSGRTSFARVVGFPWRHRAPAHPARPGARAEPAQCCWLSIQTRRLTRLMYRNLAPDLVESRCRPPADLPHPHRRPNVCAARVVPVFWSSNLRTGVLKASAGWRTWFS